MSFDLNMERLTVANLTANNEDRQRVWPMRLGRRIPHLDLRMEMCLDTRLCRDMLDDEEGPDSTTEELIDWAQLALLCLELVGGKDYIEQQMNGPYPTAFLASCIEVFEKMGSWLEGEAEDPACNAVTMIAHFVTIYGFNSVVERHVNLDPEYVGDYPPEEINETCNRILAELQLPEELEAILLPIMKQSQAEAEFLALCPTLN